jgi:hypothetical protein
LKNNFNITIKDRPHLKKVGDWTDLRLKFEVLDEKTEWQISQFHFEGPHAEANMEAHAHNFLLAFVEFLESVYVCCGWPSPEILTWNLNTRAQGADKKQTVLVEEYSKNRAMKAFVKLVLTKRLLNGGLAKPLTIRSF